MLGIRAIQLSSPITYNDGLAEVFENTTASCSTSGYSFASPTAYALNLSVTSVTALATSTSTNTACKSPYVVQAGDTCDSISLAQNVSTFSLLYHNNLNIYGTNFPGAGSTICLPPSCDLYTVQPQDSCNGVARARGDISATQLRAWNPNINALCGNLGRLSGTQICVRYDSRYPVR